MSEHVDGLADSLPDPVTWIEAQERVEVLQGTIDEIQEQIADHRRGLDADIRDDTWRRRARSAIGHARRDLARMNRMARELKVEEDVARRQAHEAQMEEQAARKRARGFTAPQPTDPAKLRRHENFQQLLVAVCKDEFDPDEWEDIVREAVIRAQEQGIEIEDRLVRKTQEHLAARAA